MNTDSLDGPGNGHMIYESDDGGNTCSQTGIVGNGDMADGTSFSGVGKLYYLPSTKGFVEPAYFNGPKGFGLGIATWKPGDAAVTPHMAITGTSMFAHWPAIAVDKKGTVYLVWDPDNRQPGTNGGCSGETPAPNSIQ